jgi:Ricin-type beta-trefoil lectin domain
MKHCASKTAVAATLVGVIAFGASAATASATPETVEITNIYDGRCLDAQLDNTHSPSIPGDNVQLWSCNNQSNQNWIVNNPGGWGTIQVDYSPYLCLDAQTDSTHNPANNRDRVQLWTCNGSQQQQWHTVSNGTNAVIEDAWLLVLDAENDSKHNPSQNGDPIQVWQPLANHSNQLWNF